MIHETTPSYEKYSPIIARLQRKYREHISPDDTQQICFIALLTNGSPDIQPELAASLMERDVLDVVRKQTAKKRSGITVHLDLAIHLPSSSDSFGVVDIQDTISCINRQYPQYEGLLNDLLANESLSDYNSETVKLVSTSDTNRPIPQQLLFKGNGLTQHQGRIALRKLQRFLLNHGYKVRK